LVNALDSADFRPSGALLRAARAAAALSVQELAEKSGVGANTIRRAETEGAQRLNRSTWSALQATYAALGASFVPEAGGAAGLRWAPPA
jgi:transcriptional regulator with XRE-family HTH domain